MTATQQPNQPSHWEVLQAILGKPPSSKPSEAHIGSPLMGELSREVYLERLWSRTDKLDMRSRRFLAIACLLAINAYDELRMHVEGALRSGDITREELGEAAAQVAFYLGWPRGRTLATQALQVSRELGQK